VDPVPDPLLFFLVVSVKNASLKFSGALLSGKHDSDVELLDSIKRNQM
jgi:hypothetical protein